MDKDFAVIASQQLPSKLSIAGSGDYDKIWIRDNVYVALAFMSAGHNNEAAIIFVQLCKIIKKYEAVLKLNKYPENDSELLHPRFTTTGDLVPGHWSNKQHDAVGVLLYGIGTLHITNEQLIPGSVKLVAQELINYLENCRYWEDEDNGMWEEGVALHASSLAACIRGIEQVSSFCHFSSSGLDKAKLNLSQLLPSESVSHPVDMALLSLVWPYGYKRRSIIDDVEANLLRKRGVIRYLGDKYESGGKKEAQWVMGLPWLGIAHFELGDTKKARKYLKKTERLYTKNGLPEVYLANNHMGVHTPLAWSHALAIVLRTKLEG